MPIGLLSNKKLTKRFTSTGEVVVERITSSMNWACPSGVQEVFVIAVAGGGGGGGSYNYNNRTGASGGGGGAGQVSTGSLAVTPGSIYTIVVGAGGVGRSPNDPGGLAAGAYGNESYFTKNFQASGGGGGVGDNGYVILSTVDISAGKSINGGGGLGATINPSAGFSGGSKGGGGAGGTGGSYTGGAAITIFPRTPTGRFSGSADYSITLGGGGGGGSNYQTINTTSGGVGGGNGGYWTYISSIWTYYPATTGSANTGGGGGGAGKSSTNNFVTDSGANGGSGVVYLIYERSPL